MYVRAAAATDVERLAGDDNALFEFVSGPEAWDADKMWWAALDLLLGPMGVTYLDGAAVTSDAGYTPVMRLHREALTSVGATIQDLDRQEIERRFDARELGDPIGPEVLDDDREWLCDAASQLRELLTVALANDQVVLFVVA